MAALPLYACDIEYDHEICGHNVEILYWYDAEMSAPDNKLSDVVSSLDEYLFDADGVLVRAHRIAADECDGGFSSKSQLPPGRYSVITWGNRSDINTVNDAVTGVTRREEMLLSVNCPHAIDPGRQANGDRLYYAYRTFTVPEVGETYVKASMVHSHLVLKYRVRWRGKAPANTKDFYSEMNSLSSSYGFMPQYRYQGNICQNHDPDADDYKMQCMESRHYIKTVFDNRERNHRQEVDMNGDKQIFGEFVTYRLRNTTPVTMTLWSAGTGTKAGEPTQIMKEIDLNRWFSEKNIELDRNLKQEFYLDFEILDDGTVIVSEVEIGDWHEGGELGF